MLATRIRWTAAVVILAYGFLTFDVESNAWAVLSLALHALPLALQLTSLAVTRVYAIWFGAFLVTQSLLSLLPREQYVTLPPNLKITVDVKRGDAHGIEPGVRIVTTDEKGFRVTPRVDYARKTGVRIFAIGGSTTECIFLDDRGTWAYLLQENLKRQGISAEVVNTGVSGTRAAQHLVMLRAIRGLHPDLAIFMVGANDWNRQIREQFGLREEQRVPPFLRHTLLGTFLTRFIVYPLKARMKGGVQEEQTIVIDAPEGYVKERRSLERPIRHTFRPAEVAPAYGKTLHDIGALCHEIGLTCVFVTQPHGYSRSASPEFLAGFWLTPPYEQYTLDLDSMIHIANLYNRFLLDFARADNHPACDLATGLAPTYENYYDELHYTETGARRVADLLAPCVAGALKASDRDQRQH